MTEQNTPDRDKTLAELEAEIALERQEGNPSRVAELQALVDQLRESRMKKIKKGLALAASSEPHEAARAMGQAQAMMAELGVTEADVEGIDIGEAEVKTREGYGACRYMSWLADTIEKTFGVKAIYSRNPGSANRLNVRYFGPKGRVELAEYTHRVVQRNLEASWAAHLERFPWKKSQGGVRQAFYIDWLQAVRVQMQALAPTEKEQGLIERYIDKNVGSLVKLESKKQELDYAALEAGRKAAADFALHRPMTQEALKLGHEKVAA
jgi:hypothetical protein